MTHRILALIALTAFAACDSGSGVDNSPDATGLTFKSGPYYANVPTLFEGTIGFADRDSNVTGLRLIITGPDGSPSPELAVPITGAIGTQSGAAGFSFEATPTLAGRYIVTGWVVDADGQKSNTLDATLDVEAGATAPTLSNLQMNFPDPMPVGSASTVTGTVAFLAPNGEVKTIIVDVKQGDRLVTTKRLTPAAAEVGGKTTGTISLSIDFTPDSSLGHMLEVSAEDAEGDVSGPVRVAFQPIDSTTGPYLKNLDVGTSLVYLNIAADLAISFGFDDSDADLAKVHFKVISPDSTTLLEREEDLSAESGKTTGSVYTTVALTVATAGRYTLSATLEDDAGQRSNVANRTFDAIAASSTAPSLSGLGLTNTAATAGQLATISGEVTFQDVDRNATALVTQVRRPDGSTLTETTTDLTILADRGNGMVSFSLPWTPPVAGYYTFAIFARDAEDQTSSVLTRGLNAEISATAPDVRNLGLGASRAIVNVVSAIAGTLAFSDSDANIATLNVEISGPGNAGLVSTQSLDVSSFAGQTTGTVPFSFNVNVANGGRYTFTAWVVDAGGQLSNRTSLTFDAIVTATTPSVSNLRIAPATLYPSTAATLSATIQVQDVDANITKLRAEVKRPDGTSLVTRELAQTGLGTTATVDFEVTFTPDVPGRHTLEVWAEDSGAQFSTRDVKTFNVTDTRPSATRFVAVYDSLFPTKVGSVTATVEFRDSNADLDKVELRLLRPNGTVFWSETRTLADVEGVIVGQFSTQIAFTPDVPGRHTLEGTLIDATGLRSAAQTTPVDVGDIANVFSACAALGTDCTGEGICYDIKASTCQYFEERLLTPPDACDDIETTGTVAECVSSTVDPVSPLLTPTNRCKMVQFWSWPTEYPIDCRCPEADLYERCKRPYELPQATTFGSGPRIRGLATNMNLWKGLVDGREMFVPVDWSTSQRQHETMIFAVNLDTGARRHFSGAWDSPQDGYTEVGTGDRFVQVMDMKKHSDGMYYAVGATSDIAAPKVWRIDPATGNRTKIFDADTAPESSLCPNYSTLPGRRTVQMTPEGWAMDAEGRFYFSNVNMPGPSIVRITVDGANISCDYVTRIMDCPTCSVQENVGGGYSTIQFDMRAFEIVGNKLYTVSDTRFIEVDITSGNRRLISLGTDIGAYGTGPINAEALGDRYTTWDPYREVFWTVGVLGGSWAVTVEPDTGDRTAWPCFHDTRGTLGSCGGTGMALVRGPLNFGGYVIDPLPPHDLYFAHDKFSIVKYEVRTGNSYIFSL